MPRQSEPPENINLRDSLNLRRIDDLKQMITLLSTNTKLTRKAELVALVETHLKNENLHDIWKQLDPIQQKAVAETVYSPKGIFDAARFKAKYGKLPIFSAKRTQGYGEIPSLLQLFIYPKERWDTTASLIPADLKQRLQQFISKPERFVLQSVATLPEDIELTEKEHELQEGDESITFIMGKKSYQVPSQKPKIKTTTHHIPLIYRDTERDALVDLPILLSLIDNGKIAVSNKTFHPSSATMKALIKLLNNNDFYELKLKDNKWEQEIGPIKAFAWPLLVQAAKLAELHGNKLTLTKTGRSALSKSTPELLHLIWQRWLKTKLLDEFNRIDAIKGQGGKGKHSMTAVTDRRATVAEALCECPVDRWVKIDDLWRFMQANDFDFEVTRNPWNLYISDSQYGSLGYQDFHNWSILQGRYILCFLFEYAGTLGIVDVAYTDPTGIRGDYNHMWGIDELSFLSRYDGLQSIRLNPLGAYCLGLTDEYTPRTVQTRTSITILPSLQINITGGPLSSEEALLLENYAETKSDNVWQLDRHKALLAVENGHQIADLREFLETRDEQLLPETVEAFIATTERQAQALRYQGAAVLIECADTKLADLIANDENIKIWCQRAGKRHLVIPRKEEDVFRKAIHRLGYGMPRV